jgi:hypothetical protein
MSMMVQSAFVRKFAKIEQGEMSVSQYARRFEELAQYGYALFDTVIKRNEKFKGGLRPVLISAALPLLRDPSDVVVEMTLRLEEALSRLRKKMKEVQVGQG